MNTKSILVSFILLFSFTMISCKSDTKNKSNDVKEKTYTIEPLTTKIGWTAYKTTSKTPVKGEFTKINVTPKSASTAKEALNNMEFSIPVSSLFSNNDARDIKLKQLFFGVMDATELLSGTIHLTSESEGNVDLKMNGITKSFPINYTISGQMVTMTGKLNLGNWNAQKAIESLNAACSELHKGEDGISKTWSEVQIDVATYLKIN